MSGTFSKPAAVFVLCLTGLVLSGCGRHGPVTAPEGSTSALDLKAPDNDETRDPSSMALPDVDGQEQKKGTKRIDRPKRPFLLDPIL